MGNNNASNSDKRKLENIKQKGCISNIHSKYILKKVFDHLNKVVSLKIINYNINIQKRLEIKFSEYIDIFNTGTKIEIEIKTKRMNMVNLLILLIKKKNLIFIYILMIIKKKK